MTLPSMPPISHQDTVSKMLGDMRAKSQDRAGLEELRGRIERQSLVIQALLVLLLEKKVIGEEELRAYVDKLDLLDGVRDGKLREDRAPVSCPRCGRTSTRTARQCQYCGEPFEAPVLPRALPEE